MAYKFLMINNNREFLDRLEEIFNQLDLDKHQGFTCNYMNSLLDYFYDISDNFNYSDVYNKLSEISAILNIFNPTLKSDIRVFNILSKELALWKNKIDNLYKMFYLDSLDKS